MKLVDMEKIFRAPAEETIFAAFEEAANVFILMDEDKMEAAIVPADEFFGIVKTVLRKIQFVVGELTFREIEE